MTEQRENGIDTPVNDQGAAPVDSQDSSGTEDGESQAHAKCEKLSHISHGVAEGAAGVEQRTPGDGNLVHKPKLKRGSKPEDVVPAELKAAKAHFEKLERMGERARWSIADLAYKVIVAFDIRQEAINAEPNRRKKDAIRADASWPYLKTQMQTLEYIADGTGYTETTLRKYAPVARVYGKEHRARFTQGFTFCMALLTVGKDLDAEDLFNRLISNNWNHKALQDEINQQKKSQSPSPPSISEKIANGEKPAADATDGTAVITAPAPPGGGGAIIAQGLPPASGPLDPAHFETAAVQKQAETAVTLCQLCKKSINPDDAAIHCNKRGDPGQFVCSWECNNAYSARKARTAAAAIQSPSMKKIVLRAPRPPRIPRGLKLKTKPKKFDAGDVTKPKNDDDGGEAHLAIVCDEPNPAVKEGDAIADRAIDVYHREEDSWLLGDALVRIDALGAPTKQKTSWINKISDGSGLGKKPLEKMRRMARKFPQGSYARSGRVAYRTVCVVLSKKYPLPRAEFLLQRAADERMSYRMFEKFLDDYPMAA